MTEHTISLHTLAVHRTGESPVCGDGVTHISLDDDGGGEFLKFWQIDSDENGVIQIAFEEWPAICKAVEMLRSESVAREGEK